MKTNQQVTREGSRAKNEVIRKSNSFDDKLAKLVPEFDSLPLKTREACSLDRPGMKHNLLAHKQLAAMCPPMRGVSDAFPDELRAAISGLSDGPRAAAIRRRGYRKMSAPVVSAEFFSFHRQDSSSAGKDRDEGEDEGVNSSLGAVAGDGMEVFEGDDDQQFDLQNQFRARSRAIRLRDGERRNRRLTEPILFTQDYSRTDHL